MIQMNLFMKQRQTHRENKLMVIKEESGGGINWEFGINRYRLLLQNKQQRPTV